MNGRGCEQGNMGDSAQYYCFRICSHSSNMCFAVNFDDDYFGHDPTQAIK